MKRIRSVFAAVMALSILLTMSIPAWADTTQRSEDYNEVQLAALVAFFQFEIVLEDEETELPNYEYAGLDLDLNAPWSYPGITWNTTVPYSVLSIDFSDYEKLSGKLDVTSMNKLQSIDVSGTEIDWVLIGENTELTEIDTSYAPVLSLDLSQCLSLTSLDCSHSAIQQLKLPEHTLDTLYCEHNYLTFATLPAKDAAKDYRYAPQKDAFFIATGAIGSITVGQKADMSSYGADTITWYDAAGNPLPGVINEKEQIYEFADLKAEEQIYAVMENDAYPDLKLKTSPITVTAKNYLAFYFWGAVLFFFVIFFAIRYMAAKRKGEELRTDPITDKIEDWWDTLIRNISDKLPKGKKK